MLVAASGCPACAVLREERDALLRQLAELTKLVELQSADLERQRAEAAAAAAAAHTPNQPERVPKDQLHLAFIEVMAAIQDKPLREALADVVGLGDGSDGSGDARPSSGGASTGGGAPPAPKPKRKGHGRRALDLSTLPVETVIVDPEAVLAVNGEGYVLAGQESSDRVAFVPASYRILRVVRRKWLIKAEMGAESEADACIEIAPVPDGLWPYFMADVSAIVHGIQSKYGDLLPLHRQQNISARHGFEVPRSTLCGWLKEAHRYCERIVDAMRAEALSNAFCIATDATGAPVRPPGKGPLERWQVFVFIADQDHIFFDYAASGTSAAVSSMLNGYGGHVLADAATIFDGLYDEGGMTEVGCWSHMRRYFWKALGSDSPRAMQALGLISKLFLVDRECVAIEMPARTEARAVRARPILAALDVWVAATKPKLEPRSPLATAMKYYENQREALGRVLSDGRLPLHNNLSELQLRNLVVGRHNWIFFETETGLKYYTVFRSLIASCALHDLNPEKYLQEILRLIPHWPVNRVLELTPKHWQRTRANLDDRQRAIITPPWELPSAMVEPQSARLRAA